ncbi:OPT oligopeptide transporter protein-domain-containing protein [Favolaschia claudopus]|uniref:OPT oligopeptide transporter protein-domain-containing protein n=1 Tax=Favolaschia claudopus TaxID=2862362 RepID=A0AAW0DU71_9AGAR
MENDFKPSYTSSNEGLSQYIRRRNVPEDYMMDPNLDLKHLLAKPISLDSLRSPADQKVPNYAPSDVDVESSDRYSAPSRAELRNLTAIEFDDESPYPEWFLGITLTILLPGVDQVFEYRAPSVFITGIVGQLISLPLGKMLEWVLPTKQFKTRGYVWSFNPGPFNIKEHVCITVMINVAYIGAYATDVLATQQMFFNQHLPYSYQILLILGTQIFGFSLGGMLRQYVVWPSSMIWPSALVNSALFNTLHKNYGKRDRGHMTRERFFLIACACSFVWYWFPGYLFTALSVFNWICWIAPNNVKVNAVFGSLSGMGMSVITFDWSMISFIGSPVVTPLRTSCSPPTSLCRLLFPSTTPECLTELYAAYSPMFMTAALCMAYFVSFAAFPAIFTHTFPATLSAASDRASKYIVYPFKVPVFFGCVSDIPAASAIDLPLCIGCSKTKVVALSLPPTSSIQFLSSLEV